MPAKPPTVKQLKQTAQQINHRTGLPEIMSTGQLIYAINQVALRLYQGELPDLVIQRGTFRVRLPGGEWQCYDEKGFNILIADLNQQADEEELAAQEETSL